MSWWVRDEYVGNAVEAELDAFVPQWIADVWPIQEPVYLGRQVGWADWLAT